MDRHLIGTAIGLVLIVAAEHALHALRNFLPRPRSDSLEPEVLEALRSRMRART